MSGLECRAGDLERIEHFRVGMVGRQIS
jgi:hypothetical protein